MIKNNTLNVVLNKNLLSKVVFLVSVLYEPLLWFMMNSWYDESIHQNIIYQTLKSDYM